MMKSLVQICVAFCFFYGTVLSVAMNGFPLRSSEFASNDSVAYYGSALSRRLKVLLDQPIRGDAGPRLRPESRYVRYMKRLYRMSSRHGRTHDRGGTSHVYNTVRLITPRDQCLEQNEEFFMQDISYNLAPVRAQEQLLKSVLLYSFDKDQATSFTSVCCLDVKEQEPADQQLCSSSHHSVSFQVQTEKHNRRKWVEVDVTTFLRPLIRAQKKDIHLLINLTCAEDRQTSGSSQERKGAVELSLRSPSLLLYLNDTSMAMHQKRSSPERSKRLKPSLFMNNFMKPLKLKQFKPKKNSIQWRRRIKKREANRMSSLAVPTAHVPRYEFPTDDCGLYDFRVSFRQLKLDHWIIAPHKYNPRYCKGICPRAVSSIYGSPVHTMVQNIIYEQLDSSVPRPSCVPSDYNPLSVLIIENDGSIAYKEYEEMIATKCTCR